MLLERFRELLGSSCGSFWALLGASGNFCVLLGASGRSWTASLGAYECLWALLCTAGERRGFCWCFWELLGASGSFWEQLCMHLCIISMYRIYVYYVCIASMYHVNVSHLCNTSMDRLYVSHRCVAYNHLDV